MRPARCPPRCFSPQPALTLSLPFSLLSHTGRRRRRRRRHPLRPGRRRRRPRRRGRPLHLRGRRGLRVRARGRASPLQRVRGGESCHHPHGRAGRGEGLRVRRVCGGVRGGQRPAAGRDQPEGAGGEGPAQADQRAGVEGAGWGGGERWGGAVWGGRARGRGRALWRSGAGAGPGAGAGGAGGVRKSLLTGRRRAAGAGGRWE